MTAGRQHGAGRFALVHLGVGADPAVDLVHLGAWGLGYRKRWMRGAGAGGRGSMLVDVHLVAGSCLRLRRFGT